ncbi:YadA-like family protein [Acinetobacter seifertii]|nr:YadA-like family protein [Acinetobacter seifertii]QNX15747.1 YadA-like family protein [Acinetobacter seifertii]
MKRKKNVASLIGGQTGVDSATGGFTGYIIELKDTTGQTHQYKDVSSAINAVSSGEIRVFPGNAVMYTADGRISNIAAGTQATDAVNLAQLNQAIADNGQHHVSINSKNPANKNNMGATADESLAIGAGVTTSNAGVKSVVIGFDAATNAKESVAIGNTSTQANGDASIAIGKTALAKSTNNIAMGTNASSNGMESIAIGTNIQIDKTTGTSDYAVGIGSYSEVQNADQAIAIGRKAIVQGDNGTAIGHESLAAKENASALGNFAKATAVSANAIGNYATASGTSANAIGDNAKATAGNANAMGKSAEATSTSSNAIGDRAKAAADNASAIGTNAQATGVNANAMGKGAKASEQDASAIGTGAKALRQDTLALGTSAVASGLNASAIGKSADAAGLNANALGNGAKAGAESSNAIGTGANVSATNGFALGTNATVTHTNAIALGSGSISGNANPTTSAIVNGKIYNYAGINPTSTVSVGSVGNERQIINVAAGRVSASSTDAINGSQLFQTNEELANLANKTAQALGGGALANQATGAISAPSYTVTTNPAGTGTKTTVNNVGAALTALDTAVNQPLSFAGDTGAQISRKLGETLNVKGGATGTLAGTGNIGVVANGTNQLDIRLAETINLGGNGSVTTGSASIKNNEVKVGTNTLTDTGLKAGNVKVNTSTNDVTGLSNITWNPAGTYNSGRAATEEQLLSAQNQLNTTLTDKGFSISAQGANSDKVKLGETVDFRNTDGNLVATRSADNTINYDLAKNISVDKVTLGNIIIDKATGINAGNQKITNVKAGDVNSTSTDAVNGSQLYTAQNNVKNVLGSSTQIDATGNLTSTNIGGVTGANTVHDAIQQVNSTATNAQTQANKGLNFAVNGVSPADNVQLGETVNFANGTNTTATYDAATNTYKYSLNDTLSLSNAGSLSIKDSAGTGTIVSVDKTGVQSGSIKLDASTGKITGVTDGLVAAGSKEAVNGGQLDAVKAIANTGWKLTTDKTGTGAVAGSSVKQITPDETVTFIAGDNIAVEQAGNKVTVATKKDVIFDSVTAGGTVINNSGLSFVDSTGTLVANSPSISKTGINAGNQKITNVKAGDVNSTSTDAVNGSQLYTAQNNVKNVLGSSTQIDATGNLTSTNIGGVTGANTVHDAIQQVNSTATNAQTQANKGLNFAVNGVSPADNVQLGETVNFANGTNTTATYDAATNTYKYSLNDTLSLSNAGSLSIKDSAGTGTIVSVDKTGVQSGSIKLDASTGKITGVTDGLVAAGSKEAVNGGQLDAVKAIANTGWKLTTDKTGTGAVAGSSVKQITPDETVTFIAGDNIAVEQAGNKVTVATKKDVVFDSVTAGGTVINNAGLSFVDGTGSLVANSPSISKTGINAGNQKITNVKAGDVNSTSTDAVNGSQLYTAQNNVKNVLGSSTQIDATGNLTSTNIGGVTGANTVHDAIQQVNNTATNAKTQADKGLNFAVNGVTPADNVQLGETVNFANGTNTTATYDAATNTYKYSLNDTLSLSNAGSLSIKDSAGTGTVVSVDKTGVQSGSIKLDASTGKITGVTDGLVAAGSKEAVNGGQLDAVKAIANTGWKLTTDKTGTGAVAGSSVEQITPDETVTFIAGDNIAVEQAGNKVTVATKKDVIFDSVTAGGTVINNSGLSFVDSTGTLVANSPSISKTGINAGNQKITNVKAGDVNSTSTDAVNGSQLYTAQNNVKNVLGSSTQIDATGNLTSTNIGGVTGANTVHDAIQQVNNTATNAKTQADKGLNFAVNGVTPADNVQLGETVNFANGTNTTATYDAATNTYKYSLNDTLSLSNAGSLSIKDSAGTGTVVSVDKTGVQSGSIKLDASTGKITGVTDGLVAAGSKEAVNGGQLDAVKAIANTGWKLTTDKTGTGAVAGSSVEQITPDETVTFIAGDNIAVEQAGNKVTVATKKDVVFDSVTAGGTVINNAGLSFVDGTGSLVANSPSISKTGINAGNQKITNVKAGDVNSTSTDAVNGSQLYTAQNNVKNVLGSSTQIDATGNLTSTNIGGVTGANTVHDAIQQVNNTATNAKTQADKGLNFAVNGVTPADNVQLGETVNFANGTNTTATYDAATNTYKYSLNDTLSLSNAGSLSIKDSAGTGTVVSVDKTGVQSGSIKLDASTGKITGVTDGLVAAGSKEAVNGGQLDAVKAIANTGWKLTTDKTGTGAVAGSSVEQITPDETVTFIAGDNIAVEQAGNKVTVATKKDVVFDSVTAGGTVINNAGLSFVDGTGSLVANSPSISKTGINAGNQKITNVKAGDVNSTSTDAVNGSQLYTAQNNVKNVLGSSTQIDATGNLTSTNIGGVTGANTVHDAIQQVNNTATNAKTQADKGLNFAVNGVTPADNVQLGETVNFANGTNTTATYDAATNTYKYSLNDTLSLSNAGSLSIKDSAGTGTVVSVDKTGVQSGSIKLDASTGKITGVTDGLVAAGSKEAVNGGQLDAVKAIANTGWKLTTDKTGTGAVAGSSVEQITPDETVTFIAGDNIAVEQAGNKVTVATKKDVVFDRVTSTDILGNTSILSATGIITQDKDGKKSASLSNTGLFVAEMNATGNTLSSSSLEAGKLTVKGTNTLVLDSVKGTLTGLSNKTLGSGDFASQGRAATEEQLNRAQSNVASILGGNAANNGGLLSMSNIGGTGESTIDDAIKSVNQVANNANKGWNVSTNGGTANNVKPNDTVDFSNKDGNVTVSNQGNNITVDLNKDIDLGAAGSVTTGDTKIDNNGLTIAGGPSVTKNGIDAGKQKVTNVADGKITADSQDAVNGGQIHDMMGAGAYDTNGNLSNIGGTGQSNINDAIAAVNKTAVQSKSTVTEGSNIKVVSNSNADGSTNYTVSTADDITLNSVTAKDINAGTVTTDKVVAGNTTVDSSGLSIKNGPSVTASGIDAGSKVVSNVSNGVQNSDAVNMGQLSQYLGGGAGYNNITQSFDAPNYQVNGGSYNNVGDALGALNQADQALGNRITNLGDQLQQAFYSTNQRIDDVEKKANAGIAAAMALENAPYIPGKYTYAAGAAYHGGENAIGLTLRKTADNGRWSLTGGVAAGSSGDPSVRVGISGVID